MANEQVQFLTPAFGDVPELRLMAREAFEDTFAKHYEVDPFAAFLDASYGAVGRMQRDLTDPSVQWHLASAASKVVGYAKLLPLRAPALNPLPGAMELEQLYVLRAWHGSGVAVQLMDWAIATASSAGAPELYLTVFDHNVRAKRFYTRFGFIEVGRCTFTLGSRVDDDRVWRKDLTRCHAT